MTAESHMLENSALRRMTEAIASIYRTGGLGAFYVGYGTMVGPPSFSLQLTWWYRAVLSRAASQLTALRQGHARNPLLVYPVSSLREVHGLQCLPCYSLQAFAQRESQAPVEVQENHS